MSPTASVETRVQVGGPVERGRTVEVLLDGWPLLLIAVDRAVMRVNDLRSTESFSIVGELYEPLVGAAVDTIADRRDGSVIVVVDTLVISTEIDPEPPTRAAVQALQMDRAVRNSLGVVVDCDVRYRQVTYTDAARTACCTRR